MTRAWGQRAHRSRGFTLIELVVVMTIITILAGAIAVTVTNRIKHAKRARAVQDIEMLKTAIGLYTADNEYAPTEEQGLIALVQKPTSQPVPRNWNGPYLENRRTVPKDPWGSEYVYYYPGRLNPEGYDLISYGADARPGGNDEFAADITNEPEE